jgi:hypothetical protein
MNVWEAGLCDIFSSNVICSAKIMNHFPKITRLAESVHGGSYVVRRVPDCDAISESFTSGPPHR